jgi:hypothetical protein
MDLFVVRTINFKLLYGFVIVRLDRRDLVWVNVTPNPTAEWVVDGLDRQDEQAWRVLRQPARRVVLWRARYYSDECAVTAASQTDGVVRICRSPIAGASSFHARRAKAQVLEQRGRTSEAISRRAIPVNDLKRVAFGGSMKIRN